MKNQLKVATPTDHDIVITRDLDAPRRLVWDALAKPELLKRWLSGPPGWTWTDCQHDMRPGGKFRWAWRGPQGEELAMHGVYHEVVPPERCVRTESFDIGCAPQAGEQLATLALTEQRGKTTLTITVRYPSKEARDGALASGMEQGMAAGYDRLDEVLASLSTSA